MSDTRRARSAHRRRSERDRQRISDLEGTPHDIVAYFKERVYATFTGLALVLVLAGAEHPTPERALLTVVLGVSGIVAAGFVSDIVGHLAVHQDFPGAAEFAILARIAGGGLGTVLVPGILIGLAWAGVMSLDAALRAGAIVYVATLAVIGWLAVRRSKLRWWQQLVALLILLALGMAVVGIQTLAHSIGEH